MSVRGIVRIAAVAAFATGLLMRPAAMAASGGIEGRVVNGTAKGPVAGVEVTLHLFSDQAEIGSTTATTARDGTFSFPSPAAGVTQFQVSAVFRGSQFRTPSLSATDASAAPVTLKVFEPTSDGSKVSVQTWVVWVDREGTGAAVQEDVTWRNEGDRAYVGAGTSRSDRVVTQVPLAPGATNFQFLGLFLDQPGTVQGSSFVDAAALPPGSTTATIRYTVRSLDHLSFPASFPTRELQVFVPADIELESASLTPTGQTTAQDSTGATVTYRIYAATNLRTGDRIEARLSGLTGGGRSALPFVAIASVVVLALGALVVWRLGRQPTAAPRAATGPRRSASRVGRGAAAPTARWAAKTPTPRRRGYATATPNGKAHAAAIGEEDVDLMIDEIATLDLSFERGLIDEDRYRALRAAAKRRLIRSRDAAGGRTR